MGLSRSLIVLLVILAAGAAVLCGFAVVRFYFTDPPSQYVDSANGEFSQASYMRDVRLRNQDTIAAVVGLGRRDLKQARQQVDSNYT